MLNTVIWDSSGPDGLIHAALSQEIKDAGCVTWNSADSHNPGNIGIRNKTHYKILLQRLSAVDTIDLANPGNNCSWCRALNHLKIYEVPKLIMFDLRCWALVTHLIHLAGYEIVLLKLIF